jgi:hypothetical protein
MLEFKVGDKVKISPESVYWGEDTRSNPRDTEGTVIETGDSVSYDTGFLYRVQWSISQTNVYKKGDLIPFVATPAKPKGLSAFIRRVEEEY